MLDEVSFGRPAIEAGKSHSCEIPTNFFSNPNAQTISVAEGNKVAMFIFHFFYCF
jgi:hypothetical protein